MPAIDDINELVRRLCDSKSEKRSAAAKRLRKQHHFAAGGAILEALKKEVRDVRTWNAQFEMILALGELGCQDATHFLWELTKVETPNTIVYVALGDALVRLCSQGKNDVACIFQLTQTNNYSLIDGAFNAMAELQLVPSEEDIRQILQIAEDPRAAAEVQMYPNDRTGVRLNVARAAAGWPRDIVRPFLENCLQIPDAGLQLAAKNALEGKYTKWASL